MSVHASPSITTVVLEGDDAPIELDLLGLDDPRCGQRPVLLTPGALQSVPDWATGLVDRGFLLAAFRDGAPADPDPARRPVFLHFDERFAHSYVLAGSRAPSITGHVIDYLLTRGDVGPDKIGWLGSSSSAIPGLSVAVHEPRLAAYLGFVTTGAYRAWLDSWHTHGLWQGSAEGIWPETAALLLDWDPLLHAASLWPTAVLMVGGGADLVVDPATAEEFAEAARPHYATDPDRLQHVVYQGCGHNLPAGVIKLFAEFWFDRYLHPDRPPPPPGLAAEDLAESVRRTELNDAAHADLVHAELEHPDDPAT